MSFSRNRIIYFGYLAAAVLAQVFDVPLYAEESLKRVAVLPFVNIEKNKNNQYLGKSITEAVRKKLGEGYSYSDMPEKMIIEIAEKNFIYPDDFATMTAAMNIGLLAGQDVVIAGNYRMEKRGKEMVIVSKVTIVDVGAKKVKDEFAIEGPADSRIWDTVGKIAERITISMKMILPNKVEWERKYAGTEGGDGEETVPVKLDDATKGMLKTQKYRLTRFASLIGSWKETWDTGKSKQVQGDYFIIDLNESGLLQLKQQKTANTVLPGKIKFDGETASFSTVVKIDGQDGFLFKHGASVIRMTHEDLIVDYKLQLSRDGKTLKGEANGRGVVVPILWEKSSE